MYIEVLGENCEPLGVVSVSCPKILEDPPPCKRAAQFLEFSEDGDSIAGADNTLIENVSTYHSVTLPTGDDLVSIDAIYLEVKYECGCDPHSGPAPVEPDPPIDPSLRGGKLTVAGTRIIDTQRAVEGFSHIFIPYNGGEVDIQGISIQEFADFTSPDFPPPTYLYVEEMPYETRVLGFKVTRRI